VLLSGLRPTTNEDYGKSVMVGWPRWRLGDVDQSENYAGGNYDPKPGEACIPPYCPTLQARSIGSGPYGEQRPLGAGLRDGVCLLRAEVGS